MVAIPIGYDQPVSAARIAHPGTGEFIEVDELTTNHLLWRNGDRVSLAPKAFDVLVYLVEHAGQVVTQDEIFEALWSESYVNPEVLRTSSSGHRSRKGPNEAPGRSRRV